MPEILNQFSNESGLRIFLTDLLRFGNSRNVIREEMFFIIQGFGVRDGSVGWYLFCSLSVLSPKRAPKKFLLSIFSGNELASNVHTSGS